MNINLKEIVEKVKKSVTLTSEEIDILEKKISAPTYSDLVDLIKENEEKLNARINENDKKNKLIISSYESALVESKKENKELLVSTISHFQSSLIKEINDRTKQLVKSEDLDGFATTDDLKNLATIENLRSAYEGLSKNLNDKLDKSSLRDVATKSDNKKLINNLESSLDKLASSQSISIDQIRKLINNLEVKLEASDKENKSSLNKLASSKLVEAIKSDISSLVEVIGDTNDLSEGAIEEIKNLRIGVENSTEKFDVLLGSMEVYLESMSSEAEILNEDLSKFSTGLDGEIERFKGEVSSTIVELEEKQASFLDQMIPGISNSADKISNLVISLDEGIKDAHQLYDDKIKEGVATQKNLYKEISLIKRDIISKVSESFTDISTTVGDSIHLYNKQAAKSADDVYQGVSIKLNREADLLKELAESMVDLVEASTNEAGNYGEDLRKSRAEFIDKFAKIETYLTKLNDDVNDQSRAVESLLKDVNGEDGE